MDQIFLSKEFWNMFLTCFFLYSILGSKTLGQHINFNYGSEEDTVDLNEEFKNSPMISAVAVSGQHSELPCNVSSLVRDDSVHLVLWYRDHVSTPIYSYDARGGISMRPKEWADPKILAGRAYFRLGGNVGSLILNSTAKEDEAVYRCRVDFKRQTTTHFRVNLTIVEPIANVRIQNSSGSDLVGAAGPYGVGESPTLTCKVEGGDPTPIITWWKDGQLLDNKYNIGVGVSRSSNTMTGGRGYHLNTNDHGSYSSTGSHGPYMLNESQLNHGRITLSTMQLKPLVKADLRTTFTCRAKNHHLAPTKEASVEIDMDFGPESVLIRGLDGPVSAGRLLRAVCEAKGSRPPATLTWWLDRDILTSTSQVTSLDGKVSTSTLELTLTPSDEGRKLTCRAENAHLPAATVEHSVTLQVLYPPRVTLEAGSSLNLDNIKEGDDVYFDCHVRARPDPFKITWLFNRKPLEQNFSQGVMVVGESLVLQSISKKQAGNYSCTATNSQGTNSSQPIILSVKYAPVCRVEQTDVYGVGRLEKTTVTCRVEADPPASTYRWAFNNTGEFVDIPVSHYAIKSEGDQGQRSDLRYSPMSDLDYGTLLCWATNAVGTQKIPCTFTVFPAGKPDSVATCRQFNHTEDSVAVICEPGYGGGMNQSFLLEAWDDGALRAMDRSETPLLEVSGLRPGTRYTLKVYAENSMGRSQPFAFNAFTLTDVAERRTAIGIGNQHEDLMSPVLGSIIGGAVAVLLLVIVAIAFAKCKRRQRAPEIERKQEACIASQERRSFDSLPYEQEITNVESPGHHLASTKETEGQAVCDLVSTSQDSILMSRSQDSAPTPSLGIGSFPTGTNSSSPFQGDLSYGHQPRKLNPMGASYLQVNSQQQFEPSVFPDYSDGARTLPYRQARTHAPSHPVSYVPVLDYQRGLQHHQPHDLGWGDSPPLREEAIRGGGRGGMSISPQLGGVGEGGAAPTLGGITEPGFTSITPEGILEARRHPAYLRSSLHGSRDVPASSYSSRNFGQDDEALRRFGRTDEDTKRMFNLPPLERPPPNQQHLHQAHNKFSPENFPNDQSLSSPVSFSSQQESSV